MDTLRASGVASCSIGCSTPLIVRATSRQSCSLRFLADGAKLSHLRAVRGHGGRRQQHKLLLVRAQDGGSSKGLSEEEQAEARLSALEAGAKKGKKGGSAKAMKELQQQQTRQQQETFAGMAEWKEGSLFPEGWESMSPMQQAGELWAGKRGMLYWMTQSAWYSVLIIGVLWVAFRFVGPTLGFYKLASDLTSPLG